MAAWGYEFYLLMLKVSLSAGEDKICIPTQPCNILYLSTNNFKNFTCKMSIPV